MLLTAVRVDLSVIAIIGIILLIGIVKKNGIMLIDFALARWARTEQARHTPRTGRRSTLA